MFLYSRSLFYKTDSLDVSIESKETKKNKRETQRDIWHMSGIKSATWRNLPMNERGRKILITSLRNNYVNITIESSTLLTMCSIAFSSSSGRVQLMWKLKG